MRAFSIVKIVKSIGCKTPCFENPMYEVRKNGKKWQVWNLIRNELAWTDATKAQALLSAHNHNACRSEPYRQFIILILAIENKLIYE